MDKDFLEKIFDQLIEEASTIYVENESKKEELVDDSDFSDIHKAKMKKLFKEARRAEARKNLLRLSKKIAAVVLCALLITAGLITSVEAWREEVVKFIMKNNDDNYMSIKFGDTNYDESGDKTESGDSVANTEFVIDDMKFLYLPEGFEFKKKFINETNDYYSFNDTKNYIQLKKSVFYNSYIKESDIENASSEKFEFEDKEVFKIVKEQVRTRYIWYDEISTYDVSSDLEEKEILKFIENIKILKNF